MDDDVSTDQCIPIEQTLGGKFLGGWISSATVSQSYVGQRYEGCGA
jgi:hypothetical protein